MYEVIGVRASSFKPKDSEKEIVGVNLYCTYEDEHIQGFGCERFFVSNQKLPNGVVPNIGDHIRVYYNRYGRIESLDIQ